MKDKDPDDNRVLTVDVVVVTYNSGAVITNCLDALAAEGTDGVGIIVVDNQSADATVELVRKSGLAPRLVETGSNSGYSAAINAGVDASTADAVLILNPDTRIRPGSIAELLDAISTPGVGLAAPTIVNPDGTREPTLRRFPTVARLLGQSLVGSQRAGRHSTWGDLVVDDESYSCRGRHDWSSGAAVLVSRVCLDQVGPWDESFFLYSEETDFAWRAGQLGYSLVFTPEAVVEHIGGESNTSSRLWSILVTNRVRLVRKHRGRIHGAAFWGVSVLGELLRVGRARNRAALVALVTGRQDPAVKAAHEWNR